MFEFLFSKKIRSLSFFDWAQRVSVALEEAKKIVHESYLEDTDANYLAQFKKSSNALTAISSVIRLGVDLGGVFTVIQDLNSSEKVYILEFTRDLKVAGLPLGQRYTRVSVSRHISNLVSSRYMHLVSKAESRIARLNSEIWSAKSQTRYLVSMANKTSKSTNELQETPEAANPGWQEEVVYHFPANQQRKAAPKKKKKTAAKKKPAATETKK